jgi:hypothetical protein
VRKLPKSFFWVDQQIIRGGAWTKLGCQARLAYIAIAASCDREGVSIWSRNKLMELAGAKDPDDWKAQLEELGSHKLIELLPEACPPAIRLMPLDESMGAQEQNRAFVRPTKPQNQPIVIHTHTSIHLANEKAPYVEPGTTD